MTPRGRSRRAGALGLGALVTAAALSGCGLFGQGDPTVARRTPAAPGATVTLLDPGSEPRRVVALDLRAGSTTDLAFAVDLHLTQRSADTESAQVIDPPITTQTVRFRVVDTDGDGAVVSFEVVDAGIDPVGTLLTDVQILELTAEVQTVVGLSGRMEVDRRGQVHALRYDESARLPPAVTAALAPLARSITSVVPALPREPIGRGARWRTVTNTAAAGLTLRQTTEYEVTALETDHFLYRATVAQDAPEQDLAADDDATATRLLAADVTGTTTGMVSLTTLESESETALRGSQVVEQSAGTSPAERVTQELDLVVTVGLPGQSADGDDPVDTADTADP